MEMTLSQQRKDIDAAARCLEAKIKEMTFQRSVLLRAYEAIDDHQEDMIKSESILAQEVRKIMVQKNIIDNK